MLLNELHHGGIRAILEWDGTVFNNMQIPVGYNITDIVDHIIFKYGDTPLFIPEPTVLKYYIGQWSARRLPLWNRFIAAATAQYNPIENYDLSEQETMQHGKKITYTGTVKVEQDDTVTNTISADNSSTYVPDNQSVLDGETNTSFTNRADTNSGTDTRRLNRHGNIGVTSAQQMLNQELDIIGRLDVIDFIADDWHDEFCLSVYY